MVTLGALLLPLFELMLLAPVAASPCISASVPFPLSCAAKSRGSDKRIAEKSTALNVNSSPALAAVLPLWWGNMMSSVEERTCAKCADFHHP